MIMILCGCLLMLAQVAGSAQEAPQDSAAPETPTAVADTAAADTTAPPPPEFLVLPPVNYSEVSEAHGVLLPLLYAHLDSLGLTYTTSDELRPLLRRHRIRSRGWIGLEAARILRRETRARYLVLASWDVFRATEYPEIGISLRVLDLEHLSLSNSVSLGMAGADFTKVLGLGTVTEVGELAHRTMEEACRELFPLPGYRAPRPSYRGCFQIALIPFDNFSGTPNAGDILTNIVLSRLMAQGYFVVEPGFVRELGLTLEVINRGGVDRRSAGSILASFDACRVVTGSVGEFSTARGAPTLTIPELAFGIRVMSPQDGNLYMMEELQGAGDDGEGMFQGGRTHALVTLANRVLQDFLEEVADNNREDILYGDHDR
jgi:hypothetical protein